MGFVGISTFLCSKVCMKHFGRVGIKILTTGCVFRLCCCFSYSLGRTLAEVINHTLVSWILLLLQVSCRQSLASQM